MIVARSDMAYQDLWVAPGSKDTALGQQYGMQEDFVTGAGREGQGQEGQQRGPLVSLRPLCLPRKLNLVAALAPALNSLPACLQCPWPL